MASVAAFLPTSAARLPAAAPRAGLPPTRRPHGVAPPVRSTPPPAVMMAKDGEGKKGGFQMPDLKSILGPKEPAKADAPPPPGSSAAKKAKADRRSRPGAAAQAVSELNERGAALFKRDFEDKIQGGPTLTAAPMPGEPGYKTEAYQRVKASSLGISSFSEDGSSGGLSAVRLAAENAEASEAAAKAAKKAKKAADDAPVSAGLPSYLSGGPAAGDSLLPDYLRPLPEDSPAEGKSWKNY